jgi:hypothetical protein
MGTGLRNTIGISVRLIGTAVAVLSTLQLAHAHLRIEESSGHLVVIADEAQLGEILDQLGERLRITLKSNLPRNVSMNGRFSGTLDEIVRRLFDGYDFVTARRRQLDGVPAIDIIVIGRSNLRPAPAPNQRKPPKFDGFK